MAPLTHHPFVSKSQAPSGWNLLQQVAPLTHRAPVTHHRTVVGTLVGHWEEAKFPAGINLVQTMAPDWRQIVSEVALDLITIPVVSALV